MAAKQKEQMPVNDKGSSPNSIIADDAVTFRDSNGSQTNWTFLRWKNRDENPACDEFFVRDSEGRFLVVKAELPLLPDGHWTEPPFPETAPCRIEPFRLIPPPCRATKAEAEALAKFAYAEESRGCVGFADKQARFMAMSMEQSSITSVTGPELWELIYGQALWPGPRDEAPLQAALGAALSQLRQEYESRLREVEQITEADVQRCIYGKNSDQRVTKEQVAKVIQDERRAIEIKFTDPKTEDFGGCLHTTLADVKLDNALGLRDECLHQQWAKKHHFNLRAMGRERIEFLKWLRRRYVNSKDSDGYFHYGLHSGQELAVLASVHYVMHFITGERVYVRCLLPRKHLREEETRQAGISGNPIVSSAESKPASPLPLRHSPNFRQLFWTQKGQPVEARLTSKQAAAVSALWHAEGRVLSREELEQEIYGDSPPADFRPDKLFTYGDGKKVWNGLISVEGCRYRFIDPNDGAE
jgi:hypothetical protein